MFVCDDFAQRFTLNIKKKRTVKKSENYMVKEEEENTKEKSDEENTNRDEEEEKRKDGEENEAQRPSKSFKDKIKLSKVNALNSFSK